jgi:hypothetical protein
MYAILVFFVRAASFAVLRARPGPINKDNRMFFLQDRHSPYAPIMLWQRFC